VHHNGAQRISVNLEGVEEAVVGRSAVVVIVAVVVLIAAFISLALYRCALCRCRVYRHRPNAQLTR
jgi:hypothetical protein